MLILQLITYPGQLNSHRQFNCSCIEKCHIKSPTCTYETIRPNNVLMAAKYLTGRDLFQNEGIMLFDEWINEYINIKSEQINFIVNEEVN